jgi:hypothetical protein
VREFVNSAGLLPHGVRLGRVDARGVYFDSGATALPFAALSDGYRTVLSLVLDLLRQLGGASSPSVAATVLIDEVDVHLHPTWQRTIGPTLCRLFPTVQFLVTTHSPLACHAAASGTIFRLPTPGSDETGVFLEGIARDRLLYGDIGEAFGTGAFGPGVTRSDEGRRLARELAELNVRALEGPLTKEQEGRRKRLREMLPSGRKS